MTRFVASLPEASSTVTTRNNVSRWLPASCFFVAVVNRARSVVVPARSLVTALAPPTCLLPLRIRVVMVQLSEHVARTATPARSSAPTLKG